MGGGKRKKRLNIQAQSVGRLGFAVDFSKYLHRHYNLEDAYAYESLLEKLIRIIVWLSTATNPVMIQSEGLCRKAEKMSPQQDRNFFEKFDLPNCYIYYIEFGNNGYGLAIGFDTKERIAYVLAVDAEHRIRPWHGKLG